MLHLFFKIAASPYPIQGFHFKKNFDFIVARESREIQLLHWNPLAQIDTVTSSQISLLWTLPWLYLTWRGGGQPQFTTFLEVEEDWMSVNISKIFQNNLFWKFQASHYLFGQNW
jgi:hypothetical protein